MISENINDKLKAECERLSALFKEEDTPLCKRLDDVTEVCDDYAISLAEYYDSKLAEASAKGKSRESVAIPVKDTPTLYRLANLLLDEEMSDKSPNKVRRTEYPFLTDNQLRRRIYGMHERNGSNGFKEIPPTASLTIGTDLTDYRFPKRSFLSIKTQTEIAMKGGESGEVRSYYLDKGTDRGR